MNAVPTLRHKYLPIPQSPEVHLFRSRDESSDVPNDPEPSFILAAILPAANIKRTLAGEVEGQQVTTSGGVPLAS